MNRHANAKTLSSYLDEEISPEQAIELERHLAECGQCRQRLEGLRQVVGRLGSLGAEPPPRGLGLELQRRIARTAPPFAPSEGLGRRAPGSSFQPVVLGSVGVILALAVIILLFLQALERWTASPDGPAGSSGVATEELTVMIGDRSFRRGAVGWVEVGLTPEEIAAAREVARGDIAAEARAGLRPVLDELTGSLTLTLGGEVVRLVD